MSNMSLNSASWSIRDGSRGNGREAAMRRHKLLKPDIAKLLSDDISYPFTLLNFRLWAEAEIFGLFIGL